MEVDSDLRRRFQISKKKFPSWSRTGNSYRKYICSSSLKAENSQSVSKERASFIWYLHKISAFGKIWKKGKIKKNFWMHGFESRLDHFFFVFIVEIGFINDSQYKINNHN